MLDNLTANFEDPYLSDTVSFLTFSILIIFLLALTKPNFDHRVTIMNSFMDSTMNQTLTEHQYFAHIYSKFQGGKDEQDRKSPYP